MKNIYSRALLLGLIIFTIQLVGTGSAFGQLTNLRINEFLALNQSGLVDEDGDYSDWIEIYNPTSQTISLNGWFLSDDASTPLIWMFPDVSLGPDKYLLVFASDKNRRNPLGQLHTNFKLSGSGEFLGLYDAQRNPVTIFSPTYPAQKNDVSYGFFNGGYMPFTFPTPGADNATSPTVLMPMPTINLNHGFYDAPLNITITSAIPQAKIYYTTDGSVPSLTNGTLYNGALTVSKTTVLRAVATATGAQTSKPVTRSYIFVDDVLLQPNNPAGYPSTWGSYSQIEGTAIADYEMDPEIVNDPILKPRVKAALKELPVVSLVTDKGHFFNKVNDATTGGIYIYTGPPTGGPGLGWERPVSFEYFNAAQTESLQADCVVELHGGHSRLAEKTPKHSLRLTFKSEFGPAKLKYPFFGNNATNEFNAIVLRGGFGNAWVHWNSVERNRAQMARDSWVKATQRQMGYLAPYQQYAHLFINGLYWGIYSPSERPDTDFAASYLEGKKEDFDVIKDYTEVADGTIDAWNAMMTLVRSGIADNAKYKQLLGKNEDGTPNPDLLAYINAENLIDYMLINMFVANSDWDHHNWVAIRNRVIPGKGFQFICWDSERVLEGVNDNVTSENNTNRPSEMFQKLIANEEFKRLLANRIQKHFFDGGMLTPAKNIERWRSFSNIIDKAVDAESARWGDYRRDVHPYNTSGPFALYTRDNHYIAQQNFMINTYFAQRTNNFINQVKAVGWLPSATAPSVRVNNVLFTGGNVQKGDLVSLIAPQGTIYYTTNGSDPVNWLPGNVGMVSGAAKSYSGTFNVQSSTRILARVFYNGNWSALTDKFLTISSDYNDLKVTEVHYHPLPDEAGNHEPYEFIEVKNTGAAHLDMSGVSFVDGIKYKFPAETELKPGAFAVIASSSSGFRARYGFGADDVYSGKLDNDGEWIKAISPQGDTIINFKYNDNIDWPQIADGGGHSLVPTVFNPTYNQNSPSHWRASYFVHGSPGRDDTQGTVGVEGLPTAGTFLAQNYPNPFDNVTAIDYQLGEVSTVLLEVVDLMGRRVAVLDEGLKAVGLYQTQWHAGNEAAGIYIYRLTVKNSHGTEVFAKKMVKRN